MSFISKKIPVLETELAMLAQKNSCYIINVLHQNKSEADLSMRPSIGTELTNKAFEVYRCEFIEDSENFKVTQMPFKTDANEKQNILPVGK